jgi:hypothetical protein
LHLGSPAPEESHDTPHDHTGKHRRDDCEPCLRVPAVGTCTRGGGCRWGGARGPKIGGCLGIVINETLTCIGCRICCVCVDDRSCCRGWHREWTLGA